MRALVFILAVAGCARSAPYDHPDAASGEDGNVQPTPDAPPAGPKPTIFTIVLENHDYAEIIGSSDAPYLNNMMIGHYGLATNYKDTIHPSLGNYLHMISGANQYGGGTDISPFTTPFPVNQPNLGSQLVAAHIPWRVYQESMGAPCRMSDNYPYATKHNPFIYFIDIESNADLCATVDVDYSQFDADLASNKYRFMWITPNLMSDGHDPQNDPAAGLRQSDAWLSQQVPKILASDGFKAGGVLFITWDEAEGRNGHDPDQIPMIVVSTKIKQAGMTSNTAFTHSSYTATIEDMLGLPRLPAVGSSTPSLMEFLQP